MAYTVKGKRVAFDNVAVAGAAGREAKCRSVTGGAVTPATTDGTTVFANFECAFTSPQTVSAAGGAFGKEATMRTVSGNTPVSHTTDYGH